MRNKIRFVHKGQIRELKTTDPTQTVLNFLRYEDALTGTKEGCAEGDCGACTVVLGDRQKDGSVHYQAVNACIQFMPMLDGRELITVEDLKSEDGTLHPVQQAMIEANGTQCGFCTPGFVMSLFAKSQSATANDANDIDDVLAGNLCRCTGYGPIIEAAKNLTKQEQIDPFQSRMIQSSAQLETLSADESLSIEADDRKYFAPKTKDELARLLDKYPEATLLAGATDIGLWVTKQHRTLSTTIYLGQIRELKSLSANETDLVIGAGTTYSEAWTAIAEHFGDFSELIRRIASTQIRNSGTIGGNIANGSPIGDTPPALIALNATLTLGSAAGSRTIPLEDFFIAYGKQDLRAGEFVENIIIPLPKTGEIYRNYKISKRFDQDISALCAAFNVTLKDKVVESIRICYGGMAGTPLRAFNTENSLIGKEWSIEAIQDAMVAMLEDYEPMSDMRASKEYRMTAAQNLLKKFFIETSAHAAPTRLVGTGSLAHA